MKHVLPIRLSSNGVGLARACRMSAFVKKGLPNKISPPAMASCLAEGVVRHSSLKTMCGDARRQISKGRPPKTNQPKQTIEQPYETKTSTPNSSTINGVHTVVQPRGPPVPASARVSPPKQTERHTQNITQVLVNIAERRQVPLDALGRRHVATHRREVAAGA